MFLKWEAACMLQNRCRFFLMLLLLTSGLTACATYMSMEIFIDNGDAVKIGLDIVDGERLSFEDIEIILFHSKG